MASKQSGSNTKKDVRNAPGRQVSKISGVEAKPNNDKPVFVCNSCNCPLNLDRSFLDVDATNLTDLGLPTPSHDVLSPTSANNTISPMSELSREIATTAKLFDLVSGAGELDHPLCEDCADSLLDQMDRELKATEELCRDYSNALSKLNKTPTEDSLKQEAKKSKSELSNLESEAARLRDELDKLESEGQHLDEEITKASNDYVKLIEEQKRHYRRYVDIKRKSCDLEDNYYSVRLSHAWADRQLNRLTQTSGLSAAFHIWHSDHFGTINGLRLGRLPTAPVDTAELNAAWGAATMLLHALAKRLNVKFRRFKPIPYGSNSYIEVISEQKHENSESASQTSSQLPNQTLPLYTTGSGIRFIWDEGYDDGMAAFAECVSQLSAAVELKSDGNVKLPYAVDERGRLHDRTSGQYFSVRSRLNSEQHWTRALKMLLTNLKWATSFVSSPYVSQPAQTLSGSPGSGRDDTETGNRNIPRNLAASPSSLN